MHVGDDPYKAWVYVIYYTTGEHAVLAYAMIVHMPLPSCNDLPSQKRKATYDAIKAYAEEMAGTIFDLDPDLEAAGIECMQMNLNKY